MLKATVDGHGSRPAVSGLSPGDVWHSLGSHSFGPGLSPCLGQKSRPHPVVGTPSSGRWEALERALAAQPQWAAHDRPQPLLIWDVIGDIGLDMAKARADADGPAVDQVLRQDIADMRALRVNRTPGFFVNGTPLRDFGEAPLKALVEQELKKGSSQKTENKAR